jgi:20S proteasome subunit alpha 7
MTCVEAVNHAARIIHMVHDEAKDKEFEMEMSWICPETDNQHKFVPKHVVENAERLAKAALNQEMDQD